MGIVVAPCAALSFCILPLAVAGVLVDYGAVGGFCQQCCGLVYACGTAVSGCGGWVMIVGVVSTHGEPEKGGSSSAMVLARVESVASWWCSFLVQLWLSLLHTLITSTPNHC